MLHDTTHKTLTQASFELLTRLLIIHATRSARVDLWYDTVSE